MLQYEQHHLGYLKIKTLITSIKQIKFQINKPRPYF